MCAGFLEGREDNYTRRAPFPQTSLSGMQNCKPLQNKAWELNFFRLTFHNVPLQAKEVPGIKIFRSSATIYYTNAEMYLEALQEKVCVSIRPFALSRLVIIAFGALYGFIISSPFIMMLGFFAEWNRCWEAADGEEEERVKTEAQAGEREETSSKGGKKS